MMKIKRPDTSFLVPVSNWLHICSIVAELLLLNYFNMQIHAIAAELWT